MSEVMLQRSLSTSSLVKQAAAAVQAQQTLPPSRRPALGRSSAYIPTTASLMVPNNRDQLDFLDLGCFSPRPSSGDRSPFDYTKRHIRFDEKVEQCIAVEGKDGEYEDESSDDERANNDSDSDSSDDGIVMMRRPKRKRPGRKALARNNSSSRTIEKLPSTTLKNKTDLLEPLPPTPSLSRSSSASKLPQSASQETIKPQTSSKNYILPRDDEESEELDSDDTESLRLGAFANRRDSVAVHRSRTSGSPSSTPPEGESPGMHRSSSGMFMPYEEDEDDVVAAGLFGKVSDTINTAKDIAHVIWNVGWRK